MKKQFPPYLDKGSSGAAVNDLHAILATLGRGEDIERDLNFGDVTEQRVMDLQRLDLEFEAEDVDGNVGPKTRSGLKAELGIDLDAVPFSGTTFWCGPDHEGQKPWNG